MKPDKLHQICFAPMEGITTRVFRQIHRKHFGGVDRYYTPFLTANKNHHFKHRETAEFLPFEDGLVPQIMTANAEDFIWAAKTMADAGYREVNLNLGCPVATVVTKNKGAGMLTDTDRLQGFFDRVFDEEGMPDISIKTRIGFSDPKEAEKLGDIYAQYQFCEVIIHPRVRQDFYDNKPDPDAFKVMKDKLSCRICYNGDIRTVGDARQIFESFPDVRSIMIGRGLVADPSLAGQIRMMEEGKSGEGLTKAELSEYISELWDTYSHIYSGERDVLFKMKELWFHMGSLFPDDKKETDRIRKCKSSAEYHSAVRKILG